MLKEMLERLKELIWGKISRDVILVSQGKSGLIIKYPFQPRYYKVKFLKQHCHTLPSCNVPNPDSLKCHIVRKGLELSWEVANNRKILIIASTKEIY